jgi:hypothetical protein
MALSLPLIQLGIVAGLLGLAALVAGLSVTRRARPTPIITARFKALQQGWYQIDMTIANRAPHALYGVSLRRVRPSSARLLAPIRAVSTRQGEFQVWADPATDRPTTTIQVGFVVAPYQAGQEAASEVHTTAWLFWSKRRERARLTLELTLREEKERPRRYRFTVTPEADAR